MLNICKTFFFMKENVIFMNLFCNLCLYIYSYTALNQVKSFFLFRHTFILIMESNLMKKVKYKEYLSNENVEIPERTSRRHRAKKLKLMNAVMFKQCFVEGQKYKFGNFKIFKY